MAGTGLGRLDSELRRNVAFDVADADLDRDRAMGAQCVQRRPHRPVNGRLQVGERVVLDQSDPHTVDRWVRTAAE